MGNLEIMKRGDIQIGMYALILSPEASVRHTLSPTTSKAYLHNIMRSGYRAPSVAAGGKFEDGGAMIQLDAGLKLEEGDGAFVTVAKGAEGGAVSEIEVKNVRRQGKAVRLFAMSDSTAMSSWFSYFTGRGASGKDSTREAIVNLREHLLMLDKKEEFLGKKIDDEVRKARANATTNPRVAKAALRQKKLYEQELESIAGRKMTLTTQVNAIESANMNKETLEAMKRGADVLKGIHGKLNVDKVDATMDEVRNQLELTNEISQAISDPAGMGIDVDDQELADELAELEQEELNKRLAGAEAAPIHAPGATTAPAAKTPAQRIEEDEEEAELRELQAQLAM
ncbi:ESCRT-III subunit protein snf7 [Rhodotorula kratochvilovae]